MNDQQLIGYLIGAIVVIGGALVSVVVWIGLAVIRRIDSLEKSFRSEMRGFDRRITRVETVLRVRQEDIDADPILD